MNETVGGWMFAAGVTVTCGWLIATSWRGLLPTWRELVLLGAFFLCALGLLLAGWD